MGDQPLHGLWIRIKCNPFRSRPDGFWCVLKNNNSYFSSFFSISPSFCSLSFSSFYKCFEILHGNIWDTGKHLCFHRDWQGEQKTSQSMKGWGNTRGIAGTVCVILALSINQVLIYRKVPGQCRRHFPEDIWMRKSKVTWCNQNADTCWGKPPKSLKSFLKTLINWPSYNKARLIHVIKCHVVRLSNFIFIFIFMN